jgi:hypothetical protein
VELVIIDLGERFELADYLFLFSGLQQSVAAQTAAERRQNGAEIESSEHFDGLFEWILRAQIVAVLHSRMHQKAPVAGEESAMIPAGDLYQLSIFGRGIINNIDPD